MRETAQKATTATAGSTRQAVETAMLLARSRGKRTWNQLVMQAHVAQWEQPAGKPIAAGKSK